MDPDTHESTSSASESSVEAPVPRLAKRKTSGATKKRKTTYYVRKDEIQLLHDQVQRLEGKLANLERQALQSQPVLAATNAMLSCAVNHCSLSVAGTQSMLSAHTLAAIQSHGQVPLQDYIRLPVDMAQRKAVMESMYERKVSAAVQFMNERTRFLDLRVAHKQTEQFTLPDGYAGVMSLDVTPFTSGHSLRQVYDAFMFFVFNQEMSMSEKLGFLTIRESEELEEFKFCQTRLMSSIPGGVEFESNAVMFASYVDRTDTTPGFAVGALDFVDQDDLYPYRPEVCIAQKMTSAIMIHELPSASGEPPVVSLVRWCFTRVSPPQFPVADEAVVTAQCSLLQGCGFIPKVVKERLSTIPPASPQ